MPNQKPNTPEPQLSECCNAELISCKFSDAVCLDEHYYDVHLTICTECHKVIDNLTWAE